MVQIPENLFDRALRQCDEARVRLSIVGDDERGLVEGIAAGPVPRAFVNVERAAKRGAPNRAEDAPGGDHIRGGIADAGAAEVNDRAEPAAVHEQVRSEEHTSEL